MAAKPPEEEGPEVPTLVRMMSESGNLVGAVLGNQYQILQVIGEGGIGVVYRARQITVDRDVAIKVLRKQYANDELAVRRFENEATAVSRLRHPNTLRLYDVQRTPQGDLYIVTELLTGCPLSDVLRQEGRLSVDRAVRTLDEVCRSLSEAHASGIVHRDLKPANIFLDRIGNEDVIKVLDFGIAKILQGSGGLTRAGAIPGTPHYMSPEHAAAARVDHRADIYALGVILYQMIAGKAPFDAATVMDILRAHITDPVPPFSSTAPDLRVPEELERLVYWMMEKAPEDRPQTVDEVRAHFPPILALSAPKPHPRSSSRSIATFPPGELYSAGPSDSRSFADPSDTISERDTGERPIEDVRIEENSALAHALTSPRMPSYGASPDAERKRWRAYALFTGLGGIAVGVVIGFLAVRRNVVVEARPQPALEAAAALPADRPRERPAASKPEPVETPARAILTSEPSGAAVIAPDGKQIGVTPLDVELLQVRTHVLVGEGGRVGTVLLDPERDAGRTLQVTLEAPVPPDGETDPSSTPPKKHRPGQKSKSAHAKPHRQS